MPKSHYNPEVVPDPAEWLSLPELERIRLVQNYHVANKEKAPSLKAHAAMHVVVENQLASGYGPSMRAMARLQAEGVTRHNAVHAIASVIAEFIYELRHEQTQEQRASFQSRMGDAIEQLKAEDWR